MKNEKPDVKATSAAAAEKTKKAKPETKKTSVKKAAKKETVYLQYMGKEIDVNDITKQAKEFWTKVQKKKVGEISSMNIYMKPEENTAYFVINGDVSGSIEL